MHLKCSIFQEGGVTGVSNNNDIADNAIRQHALFNVLGKIARADEHLAAFKDIVENEIRSEMLIGHRFDADADEHILYLASDPDKAFLSLRKSSLVLGDLINNLRSALDHLLYALAFYEQKGRIQNPNSIQFPICDSETRWEDEKNLKKISQISPQNQEKIRILQPYVQGPAKIGEFTFNRHLLSLLRDISNSDKHKMLTELEIDRRGILWNEKMGPVSVDELHAAHNGFGTSNLGIKGVFDKEMPRFKSSRLSKKDLGLVGSFLPNVVLPDSLLASKTVPIQLIASFIRNEVAGIVETFKNEFVRN